MTCWSATSLKVFNKEEPGESLLHVIYIRPTQKCHENHFATKRVFIQSQHVINKIRGQFKRQEIRFKNSNKLAVSY